MSVIHQIVMKPHLNAMDHAYDLDLDYFVDLGNDLGNNLDFDRERNHLF